MTADDRSSYNLESYARRWPGVNPDDPAVDGDLDGALAPERVLVD